MSRAALRLGLDRVAPGRLSRRDRDLVLDHLSSLRGLPVKIAQWLAEERDLLDDRAVAALSVAFQDLDPLPPDVVRDAIHEALGAPPDEVFARFETSPFAAASIGQVHRAWHPDHGPLAVKVQYPGLAEAIRSDLVSLRGLMSMVPFARPHRAVVDELSDRFREELDYRAEARALERFRPSLTALGVRMPRPLPELSAERVLTMTYEEGTALPAWAASADPQAVEQLARHTLQTWIHLATDVRSIHADPSRGNVRVAPDGSLLLLDFGCVRTLSPRLASVLHALFEDPARAGSGETLSSYQAFGVLPRRGDPREAYARHLAPLERWLVLPLTPTGADFSDPRGAWSEGRDLLLQMIHAVGQTAVHREFVFLFRAWYGLYRLFHAMGVRLQDVRPPSPRGTDAREPLPA